MSGLSRCMKKASPEMRGKSGTTDNLLSFQPEA